MKALSIVLIVMVIALTGFSAWQYIEARAVRADLAGMRAETELALAKAESIAAELTELESKLVDVFEIDNVQATYTRQMINTATYIAMNWAAGRIAVSEWKLDEASEYIDKCDDAQELQALTEEMHELLSESKLALLKGDAD